ncbi:MAG: penicillin-binding protein 1C [Bacteroidota bacterium]
MKAKRTIIRLVLIVAGACCAGFLVLSLLFPLPPLKPYSVVVEDRDGRFLQAFLAADGAWRLRTSPAEIPPRIKEILIRREDRWFYYHPGINPLSVGRALVQNLLAGRRVSGASTITMQIARMLEPRERTYLSKVIEAFRAAQLELKYSKEELLETYLSMAPLGGNIEGLRSAALIYYQTPLERLNIAQLFDLILIPGDPNGLQPDRNPDRLFAERKRQAQEWIRRGLLTETDSMIIWNTPASAVRHPLPRYAQHFTLRVKEQHPAGGDVRSSLHLPTQQAVERLLTSHLRPWKQRGVQNGAALVVRNATLDVLAYAGSEDFDDDASAGQVDAVRALRSPGSTLKPLLYAMCMDRGDLTPRTRLLDTPYDAEGFLAENYDGRYSGFVYADEALRRSLNVPMVRMLKRSGVSQFVEFAAAAGIRSLMEQQPRLGLSMILGGCGVTLEELVGAYAAFPRGGTRGRLRLVPSAENDADDEKRVWSSSAAWMVTEVLSGLDRPDIPNNFAAATNLPAVAFKTGTSYGRRDAWAVGYSSEYTVGVWVGNVSHKGNPELVGSAAAAPLLIDIFNSISSGHRTTILARPKDIRGRLVCAVSGLARGPRCSRLIDDVCSAEHTVPRSCDMCREVLVSPNGSVAYCPGCAGNHSFRIAVREEYPPELIDFWRRSGIHYSLPPPHNPQCTKLFAGDGPAILSPSADMTYFLIARGQKLVLQATSGIDVRAHAWYLDDAYIGKRSAGEKLFIAIGEGNHTITCADDRGRASTVHITVRNVL